MRLTRLKHCVALTLAGLFILTPFSSTFGKTQRLKNLSPEDVKADTLAGDRITDRLTAAPGNGAAIGGLKVTTDNGWFAARPSGTEEVYKIYAESFVDEAHLERIFAEAQEIVSAAFRAAGA